MIHPSFYYFKTIMQLDREHFQLRFAIERLQNLVIISVTQYVEAKSLNTRVDRPYVQVKEFRTQDRALRDSKLFIDDLRGNFTKPNSLRPSSQKAFKP